MCLTQFWQLLKKKSHLPFRVNKIVFIVVSCYFPNKTLYLTSLRLVNVFKEFVVFKCKSWIFCTISYLRKWFKASYQSLALLPPMNFHSVWPNFYSTPFFSFLLTLSCWWFPNKGLMAFYCSSISLQRTYTPAQPLFFQSQHLQSLFPIHQKHFCVIIISALKNYRLQILNRSCTFFLFSLFWPDIYGWSQQYLKIVC